jgi:hypothetical protein
VLEVDVLGLLGENGDFAARIVIALLEGLEGGGSLSLETQLRRQFRPVELEGCATLEERYVSFRDLGIGGAIAGEGCCRGSNCAFRSFCGCIKRGLTYSDGHCDGFRRDLRWYRA